MQMSLLERDGCAVHGGKGRCEVCNCERLARQVAGEVPVEQRELLNACDWSGYDALVSNPTWHGWRAIGAPNPAGWSAVHISQQVLPLVRGVAAPGWLDR